MSISYKIKLNEAFGDLPFGATTEQAIEMFGEPNERAEMEDDNGTGVLSMVWHYFDLGFSLFFDLFEVPVFSSVEISHEDAELWGMKVFDLNEKDIIGLFKKHQYDKFETELHAWGEKRLSFDDVLIDFYFENEQLNSVNYGVIFEADPPMSFSLN